MESATLSNPTWEHLLTGSGAGRPPSAPPRMDLEFVQVRLRCPVIPALHPAVEKVRHETFDWALQQDLARPRSERYRMLRELLASALPARCWPAATVGQLRLASDWIAFLASYRHAVGTAELRDRDTLSRLSETEDGVVALLEGAAPSRIDGSREPWRGFARAAEDLRRRLEEQVPRPGWLYRFAGHTAAFFHGVRWERLLDLEDPVPDLTVYRHRRLLNSAVFTCFDLAAIFIPELEPASLEGPTVRALEDMASNYVNWVDDIYKFDREMAEGKKANLVLILQERLGLSISKARDEAIDMCNREIEAFFDTAVELGLRGELRPGVESYVAALEAWMRGNLDAYGISRRWAEPRIEARLPATH